MNTTITKLIHSALTLSVLLLAACSGGGGGSTTATTTTAAPTIVPRFAYVANYMDSTVSMYTVNAATGQLRNNGYVVAGKNPQSVTVDPSGKFAYVANQLSNDVSAFTVNAGTGTLTPINCVTGCGATIATNFAAGISPSSVTVDPTGKFAYVTNGFNGTGGNTVSQYIINPTTGQLTLNSSSAAGTSPWSIAIDPSGKFAYVANPNSNDISAYTINASSGALTQVACGAGCSTTGNTNNFTAGTGPQFITIDPTGRFVYATNYASNDISAYTINASTGTLTQVACSAGCSTVNSKNFVTGVSPWGVTIDPSGKFVYVANDNSNDVSAYTINANTGALTQVACSAGCSTTTSISANNFTAGTGPQFVSIDPSGKFAYVANYSSNTISAYSINASSGALTALPTIAGRPGATSIAMTKGTAAVTYTPKFAYVANFTGNSVSAFTINANGALTAVTGSPYVAATGSGPYSVAVDPASQFAYVANALLNNVSAYAINASTGALANVDTVAAGSQPAAVAVDPSGRFVYVANNGANDVSAYTVNAGIFTQITCTVGCSTTGNTKDFTAGTGPYSVTVDPTGRFVYVPNFTSNNVSGYTINASTGALTSIGIVATGTGPTYVTVDPTGKYAYVAYGSTGVTAYTINTITGALTSIGTATASAPISVAVDPTGKFAYSANNNSNNVTAYSIYATTGALTNVGTVGTGGTNIHSVTVDSSGKFVYTANSNSGDISAYTIDATSGAISQINCGGGTGCNTTNFAAGIGATSIFTTGTWQ